nr:MAG TPA: 24-sterol C-methyltransferase [Caudoviricetes sp.]
MSEILDLFCCPRCKGIASNKRSMYYYLTDGRFRQLTPDLGSKLIAYNRKGRN